MSAAKDILTRRKNAIRLARTYPEGSADRQKLMDYAADLLKQAEAAGGLTTDEAYGLMAD